MTYHLPVWWQPFSCAFRIEDEDLAIPFYSNAQIDLCIAPNTVFTRLFEKTLFTSILLLSFGSRALGPSFRCRLDFLKLHCVI